MLLSELPATNQIGRLRQMCRRGTLELDILLVRWLEHYWSAAPAEQQQNFLNLLDLEDDQLQSMFIYQDAVPEEFKDIVADARRVPA